MAHLALENSRDADIESDKGDGIPAYRVEVWVPRQKVCKTDAVLGGHAAAGIVRTPCVCLTGRRCAETGATIDGRVEVLAVDIESIGVQHAVGRNPHSFGHGVTVIARRGNVRASAGCRFSELGSARSGCSNIGTIGWRCTVRVSGGIAACSQRGEVACHTLIITDGISELESLYSKPAF